MKIKPWSKVLAVLLASSLVAVACGSDDDSDSSAVEDTAGEDAVEDTAGEETADEETAGGLAAVCPNPVVIQTDWFPQSEHGAIYNLMGDDYEIDANQKSMTGPMVVDGEEVGLELEIRSGGPGEITGSPGVAMTTDDSITMGFTSTEIALLEYENAPMLSVLATLDQSPLILYWDPETLPDVETIADLGEQNVEILSYNVGGWRVVLDDLGVFSFDQIDPSWDGSPSRFVLEGDVAQPGFVSSEPFLYEYRIEEYGRPVAFQLLSEVGFDPYVSTLGIRPGDQEELDACLHEFVPVVQQSIVDFSESPERANAIIVDAVEQYDTWWTYDAELAAYSVETQAGYLIVGNGPDNSIGNFDIDRAQALVEKMRSAGLEFPDDLSIEDLYTNEYIDESISIP